MGEKTIAHLSSPTRKALRTSIPSHVVKMLGLKAGDALDWDHEVRNGKIVFVVTKDEKE